MSEEKESTNSVIEEVSEEIAEIEQIEHKKEMERIEKSIRGLKSKQYLVSIREIKNLIEKGRFEHAQVKILLGILIELRNITDSLQKEV